jgi:bifunctional non-homologous end joining protein LigD
VVDQLPQFIKPMLATTGSPFDSDEHFFEIKWDGLRTTVYVDQGSYRLKSRRGIDVTDRYPEFQCFETLPEGTILDGELVVLDGDGRPNFRAALRREQARSPRRVGGPARSAPATLIVFDQLFKAYQPLVRETLRVRRQALLETVNEFAEPTMILSDGITGPGKAYFEEVVANQLEGLVAKRLDSRYLAGRRSDAWIKMRKRSSILCAIIGYVPKDEDFESLILATDDDGELRCVGRVGSGFNAVQRKELASLMRSRHADQPLISCSEKGQWLTAGLFCSIAFLERTARGDLREPVFEKLINS